MRAAVNMLSHTIRTSAVGLGATSSDIGTGEAGSHLLLKLSSIQANKFYTRSGHNQCDNYAHAHFRANFESDRLGR